MSFVTVSRGKNFINAVLSQDSAALAAQEAEISRRVRQDLARLRDQAEAQARAEGEAAARAALGPQAAALEAATAALLDAAGQLTAPLAAKEQDLADLVTELAFLLARHITGAPAGTNPTALLTLVTQLLTEAATERGPRQTILIRVSPADHAHLTPRIPQEAATLIPDPNITAGGALLEIVTPDGDPLNKIEWDATLPGRLEAIRTALGVAP